MSQKFFEVLQVLGVLALLLGAFASAVIWALRRSAAENRKIQAEQRAMYDKSIELQAEQNRLMADLIEALRETRTP